MTCLSCMFWRRMRAPVLAPQSWNTLYGVCSAPRSGPRPYWSEKHPTGDILVHETHGADCAASKEKRR